MVKLMQGRTIGTGSFREDDIEDDIDFRVALRGVLASTGSRQGAVLPSDNRVTWMYRWSCSNYWQIILSSH